MRVELSLDVPVGTVANVHLPLLLSTAAAGGESRRRVHVSGCTVMYQHGVGVTYTDTVVRDEQTAGCPTTFREIRQGQEVLIGFDVEAGSHHFRVDAL
jgi:hypothetical protein